MRPCRAFSIAACLALPGLIAAASGVASAQTAWPAPPQQQQAPAGTWPAPAPQAPAGAWPAPAAQQPQASAPTSAWPAPSAPSAAAAAPPAFTPQPQAGFGPAFGQQQSQEPPCYKAFMSLRADTEKKGKAIQAASKRKVPPPVACRLFNDLSASQGKLVKYASANATACQIPPQAVANLSNELGKINEIRARVCDAAAAAASAPKPRGPSLSDALSAPVPDSGNIRTGRGGTFDTLSGSPLAR